MTNNTGNGGNASHWLSKVIPLAAYGLAILGFVFGKLTEEFGLGPSIIDHLKTSAWYYVSGILVLVGTGAFVWQFRKRDTVHRALQVVIFLGPLLLVAILAIGFVPPSWQELIARLVFVLIAALLPAAMYYLFLAAKRPSLFEEFVANLRRLGLVYYGMDRVALDAYLQKFEASFGSIPEKSRGYLIQLISSEAAAEEEAEETSKSASKEYQPRGTGGRLGKLVAFEVALLLSPNVLLPLTLATILIGLGWLLVLPPLPPANSNEAGGAANLMLYTGVTPVSFAFLGAYFFSLQMLFRRFVLNDLRPSAYIAVIQRIVLSVIAVWVFLTISERDFATLLGREDPLSAAATLAGSSVRDNGIAPTTMIFAFLIGVFPGILWDFLLVVLAKVTFAEKYFRKMTPEMPLGLLDGLTIFHESRLEEEDIENVPNMASVDIVQLLLSTRFAPNRVIDWVDQAILYTALGPEGGPKKGTPLRDALRRHGIRTASGLIAAYKHAGKEPRERNDDGQDVEAFLAILDGEGRSPVRSLVDTLETNPNLHLITAWQSESGCKHTPDGQSAAPAREEARAMPASVASTG